MTGSLTVRGTVQLGAIQGAGANVADNGTLDVATQPLQSRAATLGGLTLTGRIAGRGELDVCGSFDWQGGYIDGPGATVLCSTNSGHVDPSAAGNSSVQLDGGALVNHGNLTWSDGAISTKSPGVIWNTGTWDANSESGTLQAQQTMLYNTGTLDKTSGTGTTEIDALVWGTAPVSPASSGQLSLAGENLPTPTNQDPSGPVECATEGTVITTGWVATLSNPVQLLAGDAGADCSGGATASGASQLLAEPYGGSSDPYQLRTDSCAGAVCNMTVGTEITPGNPGYYQQSEGATYALAVQLTYSPSSAGGGATFTNALNLAPGTSTDAPLPGSTMYSGDDPAFPNRVRAMCGDPVDCATGDQTEQQTDLTLGGRGGGFRLTRSYNSQLAVSQSTPGPFGYGWTGPFDAHISINTDAKTATVTNANGSTVTFSINADGTFSAPAGAQATLSTQAGGDYAYVLHGQDTLLFDSAGNVLSDTARGGYTTTFGYNSAGQVSSITAASGRQITFTYNADGQVATAADPVGLEVDYAYDGAQNLTEITDNAGVVDWRWKFGYDGQHQLTSMTDANKNTTTIQYTGGKVTYQKDPMGRVTTWSYGPDETDVTLPNHSTTRELFDASGDLLAITKAQGTPQQTTQAYTYNAMLEPVTVTDGDKHTTTNYYDSAGNRIAAADSAGQTTGWTYDNQHDLTSTTTPRGVTTTYTYTNGHITSVSKTAGGLSQTWGYTYTDGDLTATTDPRDYTTHYGYNSQGDQTSTTNPSGDEETWTYDADGRVASDTSPRGNNGELGLHPSTVYSYDNEGRLTTVTTPGGHVTAYEYDADGNQTKVTDPDHHATTTAYDADNESYLVTLPDNSTEFTAYDGSGQIESQTTGGIDNTITYQHNPLGEVTSATDPDQHETDYTYDKAGNLTGLTNAKGTTGFSYTPTGHLSAITYSEAHTHDASFGYNADGLVTSMNDGTGASSYTYDGLDRLTSTTNGDNQTTGYGYDAADNQTSLTYPDGQMITRAFNNDEQLASITDAASRTTTFQYDPDGNLETTTFPSATGDVDTNTYDHDDQLTGQTFAQNTTTLASLSYTPDGDGQLQEQDQTGLPGSSSTSYTYDDTGRLSTAGSLSYSYNADGDPTKLDGQTGYEYDKPNQLVYSPTASYTYNNVGGRAGTTPTGGQTTTYSYDQAGRLTAVTPESASDIRYAYDGNGGLAARTSGGTTSQFAWDQTTGIPLLLTDGTNDYIYGPDGLPVEQIAGDGTPTYVHHDQLGSTRLLTDSTGAVTGTYTYNPYGTLAAQTGSATTPLGYAGQYTDPATGLQYDHARFYDPTTGQFLSQDPLQDLTGQPYAYANDNPTNLTDPEGLDACGNSFFLSGALCSISDAAAGALNGLTGGLSTHIAGSIVGFNPSCADFGGGGSVGQAFGFAGSFLDGEEEASLLGNKVVPWVVDTLPGEEEEAVQATLAHIDAGTTPSGALGRKWATPFRNQEGDLPGGTGPDSPYLEHRVPPAPGTAGAGARRIVTNPATGEVYYTWTHYGDTGSPSFVRIR